MEYYIVNNSRFDNNGFSYGEYKGKINTGSAVKCEECGSFLTMLEWLPPLEIKLSRGKLGDVIFGTFSHFIVSEKFKNLYEEYNLSGITSFEPVSLYRKTELIMDKYFLPKILCSEVHVNIQQSGIVFEGIKECSTCQKAGRIIKKLNGLYFSNEEIIKEDIFYTYMLPGTIVFSDNFRKLSEGLLNLTFIDAKQYIPSWIK